MCVCSPQCHQTDIFLRKHLGWSQPNLARENTLSPGRVGIALIRCYAYNRQLHGKQKSMKKGDCFWGAQTEGIFSEIQG